MARFVVLVIDSFGVGAMKDVARVRPQDAGANTCGHILGELPQLRLPTLEKLGLINALGYAPGVMKPSASAVWGVAELQHEGGDTFMGHQEILGTRPQAPLRMPFNDVIDGVEQALKAAGWQVERRGGELAFLWVNDAVAVGDNLEADLGQVYNVTANLSAIAFDEVLKIGRVVREQVQVGRVITFGGQLTNSQRILDAAETMEGRFVGINAPRSGAYESGFQVRHMGFGVDEQVQVPQKLYDAGIPTVLVGKVADIVGNAHGRNWQNLVDSQQIMDITLTNLTLSRRYLSVPTFRKPILPDTLKTSRGMPNDCSLLTLIFRAFWPLWIPMTVWWSWPITATIRPLGTAIIPGKWCQFWCISRGWSLRN